MKKSYLSRRESIILSAIDIIDELGIHGLSTREIARRQDISDAALYKHFKSKKEIILAVIEYYSKFDAGIVGTIQNNNMSPTEGIIFLVKSCAEYYENYPPITAILSLYEYFMHDIIISEKMKRIIDYRSDAIKNLVIEGQKKGNINIKYDPEDLADTIIGISRVIIFKWRVGNYNFSLKERIVLATKTLLEAVRTI